MPRKTTHRPFAVLRRREAGRRVEASEPPDPLESIKAEPLPDRPRRVRPPSAPATIAKPRPATPAFLLTRTAGRVEGTRRGLDAQQRRGLRGTPAATCDLHGHDAPRAREKLQAFLKAEHARGRTLVLVIVGKGLRSPGKRPVLAHEIADWLTEPPLAALVLAFYTAPRELGGEGGLVVRLSRESDD
jgi:DNA-nicking Smr family endonuclease